MNTIPEERVADNVNKDASVVQPPLNSQTASEYIDQQLALEADAKEILPYKFDKCTYILGPLRQSVFACLTCSPPPASAAQVYTPAGICYACSISCHTEHNLVELFQRRNFVCDCGTTRFPSTSPCQLRADASTGKKGVASQEAAQGNTYNHNYQNKFCGCAEEYDADTERGTMYQCIGLGPVEAGGCGEDWWHPECLMGLPRDWLAKNLAEARPQKKSEDEEELDPEHPVPQGFPDDEDFTTLVCYKCVEANPWIKQYAGTEGFLRPVVYGSKVLSPDDSSSAAEVMPSLKRKASDTEMLEDDSSSKRLREEEHPSALLGQSNTATLEAEDTTLNTDSQNGAVSGTGVPSTTLDVRQKHDELPTAPKGTFSILAQEDFRDQFCRCPQCFPNLMPHPQLQEEEDVYEPSISDSERSLVGGGASGTRSAGTASLLDRGEAALNTMDRVKAIEGVMVYNHLKDKVKEFLKPYAESGKTVSADDIKEYFEKLRGDHEAVKEASTKPVPDEENGGDDQRREQSGY